MNKLGNEEQVRVVACLVAGLWDRWVKPPSRENYDTDLDEVAPSETVDSFTIITRAANEAIAPLHDRMTGSSQNISGHPSFYLC
jgi:putative SOS response-associated peptidase YedK